MYNLKLIFEFAGYFALAEVEISTNLSVITEIVVRNRIHCAVECSLVVNCDAYIITDCQSYEEQCTCIHVHVSITEISMEDGHPSVTEIYTRT